MKNSHNIRKQTANFIDFHEAKNWIAAFSYPEAQKWEEVRKLVRREY